MLPPEILAGFCVGWSEALVGYPFVTAKVLRQTGRKWWGHSPLRYYQGVGYPLMASVGFNTVVFPLKDRLHNEHGVSYAAAGALAGLVVTPQMWFLDSFAIRRQINQSAGGLRAFDVPSSARGVAATAARESLALSAYFSVYHELKERCCWVWVAGGLAGLANWTLTFPVDTVRSRVMADKMTFGEAWTTKGLWRGYSIAATRAVVVNAASFSVYEQALTILK